MEAKDRDHLVLQDEFETLLNEYYPESDFEEFDKIYPLKSENKIDHKKQDGIKSPITTETTFI